MFKIHKEEIELDGKKIMQPEKYQEVILKEKQGHQNLKL